MALRITNCASDAPEEAVVEVVHLQNLNTRARGDKTYHLVVSFPPGERPSPDQLHVIEGELIGVIGLGEHQRMSAVHDDTEHLHIHIAVNKVHPETLRCIEPYYDKKKLFDACRQLEQRLGLEPLKLRGRDPDTPALPGSTASMEIHVGIESFVRARGRAYCCPLVSDRHGDNVGTTAWTTSRGRLDSAATRCGD